LILNFEFMEFIAVSVQLRKHVRHIQLKI